MKPLARLLAFALTLPACTTIDDWTLPDPLPPADDVGEDGGQEPHPPQVPGAWGPCDGWDDPSCSPAELGCYLPSSLNAELGGHCTWICLDSGDCADLWVNEKAVPACIPFMEKEVGVCALGCMDDDQCPTGMTCNEVETNPGLTERICAWESQIE